MGEREMQAIGRWMLAAIAERKDKERLAAIRSEVEALCSKFPVPGL
jgi:glycine/serine hydroxymethyltransferase